MVGENRTILWNPLADLFSFRRDLEGALANAARRPGDAVEVRLGRRALLLREPADIRHVIATNAINYEKAPRLMTRRARRIAGDGVFTARTANARERRSSARELLHRGPVAPIVDRALGAAEAEFERLASGGDIDLAASVERMAERAMLAGVFGAESPDEVARLARGVAARRRSLEHALTSLVWLPGGVPVALAPARRRALGRLDAEIARLVASRRTAPRDDLITLLVRGRPPLDDRQAREELLGLAVTGYVTIGRAVTSTLVELASNPAIEQRLRAELAGVLGGRAAVVADLDRLPLCRGCVSEALRLHPPTPMFVRRPRASDSLPSGLRVPAGRLLLLSPYVVQRDPRWFEDPERFEPARFAADESGPWPAFAYFPFGGGTRVCLGRTIAVAESVLLVARVLRQFHLELGAGSGRAASASARLRPAGAAAPG